MGEPSIDVSEFNPNKSVNISNNYKNTSIIVENSYMRKSLGNSKFVNLLKTPLRN